jgi:hypothetical protein
MTYRNVYDNTNRIDWINLEESERKLLKRKNNPDNKRAGHYTGRCMRCKSDDLWDDCTAYGCNKCGAKYYFGG